MRKMFGAKPKVQQMLTPSMDMAEPRYTWLRLRRREWRPKMKARPWVCPPDPNLRLSVLLLRLVDSSFLFSLLDATFLLLSTLYFNGRAISRQA